MRRVVPLVTFMLAVLAALAALVTTPGSPASASDPRPPSVDLSATPQGWRPVDFGDLQLSVPPSWAVLSGGEQACGDATGVLILGHGNWCPPSSGENPAPNTSIVTISATRSPLLARPAPTLVINGLSLYAPDISPLYFIPALEVEVTFNGPLPPEVLHSVTYAPRAVALEPGPASIPKGWRFVSFKGVEVAIPRSWTVTRSAHAPACGTDVVVSRPGLTLASAPALPVPCPAPPLTAPRPIAGVEMDGFSSVESGGIPPSTSCVPPTRLNSLDACIDSQPANGELVVQVSPTPGRTVTVRIGMFGSGRTGRAILDSLRRS
jgi:hypothetical protein